MRSSVTCSVTDVAGSWGHMVHADGTPYNDELGAGSMLENMGDVAEALGECYGMIWVLADWIASDTLGREQTRADLLRIIGIARSDYRKGARLGREMT